jgi:hypothetical protein
MKTIQLIAITICAALIASCESTSSTTTSTSARMESLLVAAGFNTRKPQNAHQQTLYASLPNQVMHSGKIKGKQLYGYKDESKGVVYVGGTAQYQKLKRLVAQQKAASAPKTAAATQAAAPQQQQQASNNGQWNPTSYADPTMQDAAMVNTVTPMDGNAVKVYTEW